MFDKFVAKRFSYGWQEITKGLDFSSQDPGGDDAVPFLF
jgi:hypothetical protein